MEHLVGIIVASDQVRGETADLFELIYARALPRAAASLGLLGRGHGSVKPGEVAGWACAASGAAKANARTSAKVFLINLL